MIPKSMGDAAGERGQHDQYRLARVDATVDGGVSKQMVAGLPAGEETSSIS